jgi:hypothetical protein
MIIEPPGEFRRFRSTPSPQPPPGLGAELSVELETANVTSPMVTGALAILVKFTFVKVIPGVDCSALSEAKCVVPHAGRALHTRTTGNNLLNMSVLSS